MVTNVSEESPFSIFRVEKHNTAYHLQNCSVISQISTSQILHTAFNYTKESEAISKTAVH